MSNLIGTRPNQVPTNGMLGTMAFVDAVDSITSTATTSTTLTSTATLLQITPSSYGVAVTLPDATTCVKGGPLHIIDNKGAYPVRMLNSAGTLLGFVYGGVVSHVSLVDNATAAGTWTIENNELVGASAQLLTTTLVYVSSVIDLGSNRELIYGLDSTAGSGTAKSYAVVYDRSTNTFGNVTLVRNATIYTTGAVACLAGTDKVLAISCTNASTAFEAVVLSISGTTITVNTAATATLSANISAFADGCGLIAVGSSFVCSYTVATPAAQIRALSISGTTVTIGSATVLDGTAGGLIAASSDKVIAVSTATTHLYTKPYTVSGSSLSAGTGTDTTTGAGNKTLNKFAALGTRWFAYWHDATANKHYGTIISLSGTTTTVTEVDSGLTVNGATGVDAIIISSSKVLMVSNASSSNANILTDTAGTASAGTAITLDGNTVRACMYVSGTTVAVRSGNTSHYTNLVDCSGASPVLTRRGDTITSAAVPSVPNTGANGVLNRGANSVYGSSFAQTMPPIPSSSAIFSVRVSSGETSLRPPICAGYVGTNYYRGKSDSERWVTDAATVITKIECVA